MSVRINQDAVADYIAATFAPEDALLQRVRAVGESLLAGMQVSAAEGKMLYLLARMINAKRILEFGSFVGYSSIWLARSLPAGGELISFERNPLHAGYARDHTSESQLPIMILEGDALELLPTITGRFDLVFLDGEKRRYPDYLDAVTPLVRTGGLVIADNSLLFGAVLGVPEQRASKEATRAMQQINERLANSGDYEGIMLPTAEGMTIGIRRYSHFT